jgi:hypothetical protein
MFPQTIGCGKRRDWGATAEELRSSGKRIDADTALLLAAWAITALLFDYRSNYRQAALASQGRLSKNGAIIDQSADHFR